MDKTKAGWDGAEGGWYFGGTARRPEAGAEARKGLGWGGGWGEADRQMGLGLRPLQNLAFTVAEMGRLCRALSKDS